MAKDDATGKRWGLCSTTLGIRVAKGVRRPEPRGIATGWSVSGVRARVCQRTPDQGQRALPLDFV